METKQDFDMNLKQLLKSDGGTLSIGITPGRGRTILPRIIPAFHQAFPNCELNIFEEDVATLETCLLSGTIELASFTSSNDSPVHAFELYRYRSRSGCPELRRCICQMKADVMINQSHPGPLPQS